MGGGHNTAVMLCLVAVYLIERGSPRWTVAAVLPVAAIAHPIAAPFAVALAGYLLFAGPSRADRARTLASLVIASATVAILLRPPEAGVWNPAARDLDPLAILGSLPALAATLFTPNLNSLQLPGIGYVVVSLAWLTAFVAAVAGRPLPRRILLYALAPIPVLFTVQPDQMAPRHLLLVAPIACIAIALALPRLPRPGRARVLALLLVLGAAVHLAQVRDPNIYGPSPQDRGIERANVLEVVLELESRSIGHVYCLDPMFQWNLTWTSRERILARWADPLDRVPDYPARVDAARHAGRPYAVVGASPGSTDGPQRFEILPLPDSTLLESTFPPSPGLNR